MLSSITPLGQRSKGKSWERTVAAFWIGAIGAGAAVFSVLGWIGDLVEVTDSTLEIVLVAVPVAAALDLVGVRAPGPRRQVDEDWLGGYRDWVTGFGFGAQLGVGFATIVPSFGTWALYLIAVGSGLPLAAVLGAGFGLGRSLLLVATRKVHSASTLATIMERFNGTESVAGRIALAGYALVATVGVLHVA